MLAVGAVGVFLYALFLIPFTPDAEILKQLKVQQPSVVHSSDGEVLTRYRRKNRQWVALDSISPHFVEALLATEDRRFYEHHGIDYRRVLGSIGHTLTGDLQGASTITQQLARNLFPERIGREVTLTRKLKEVITALKIEQLYKKEEILEAYVNTVPFLYSATGIEVAAQAYFDKPASQLNVLESATLVGMLKGTAYYNPVRNPERARQRRNVVLHQMRRYGQMKAEQYEQLKEAPLELDFQRQALRASRAPHFTERVRQWVTGWANRNGYDIYADSLVIHTTLDMRLQRLARQAVRQQAEGLQAVADVEWGQARLRHRANSPRGYLPHREEVEPFAYFWQRNEETRNAFIRSTPHFRQGMAAGHSAEEMLDSLRHASAFMDSLRRKKTRLEAGLVAMNPRTGQVKAWVGSRNFEREEYDHVAQARRQPGSTFKPFVYAAALEEGYTPRSRLRDRRPRIRLASGEVWRPANASGETSGRLMTLREGLTHSKNTITAQLIDRVGAGDVADLARRAGIRRSDLKAVPSLALGTSPVTLIEMATAYSTLAAGGVYREPVLVTRIEDRRGKVVYRTEPEKETVLSESTAAAVVDMMRGVIDEGTGRRIRSTFGIRADVAGKTGTTQHGADGWFMLMHPDLVTGAWVGFNDQRVTFRSEYWGQGGHNALWIIGDFFRQALRDKSLDMERPPPPGGADERREDDGVVNRVGRWLTDVLGVDKDQAAERKRRRPSSNMGVRTEAGEAASTDASKPERPAELPDQAAEPEREQPPAPRPRRGEQERVRPQREPSESREAEPQRWSTPDRQREKPREEQEQRPRHW